MNTILVGGKHVPVYHNVVELTGTNIQANPSIPSPSWGDAYLEGLPVGDSYRSDEDANSDCTIGGGRTSLYDNAELIVSAAYNASSNEGPTKRVDATIAHYSGETAEDYYSHSTDIVLGVDRSGTSTYIYVVSVHWIALPFKYVNSSLPDEQKVTNYKIFAVTQSTRITKATGDTQITYGYQANPIVLNFAYHNKNHNTYLRMEELPPAPDDPNTEDPDYPSEPSEPDPDHTITVNPIPIPNLPSMGSATAGFLTMYKLGLSAINQFASDMFASSVWEAIKLFFGNPMDFLVGCMLLPFEPSTGSSYYPKFGLVTFEHAYPAVDNQYKEIDCGYVDIKKFWGSCFDYEPFTKLQIWLPYIGYRDIPTDEFMGEQLHVVYHCDCLTGDCVAFITTTSFLPGEQAGPSIPRVLAQYYGNCGVRVPFSSVNFDAAVAAGINLIGAAASMGLSKGIGGVASHEASKANGGVASMSVDEGYSEPSGSGLAGATINMVESMKPTVQKGGAAGASNGYMSIQKPYLIKRIPRQSLPENYMTLKGYPSNIGGTLSQFSGYAEVENIQLNNIPAMEGERKEIMNWLAGGVII